VSQNVIELNGKRYDAITGAYLGKARVLPKHITDYYVHGKVIDGFVRPSHPGVPRAKPHPPEAKQPASHAKPEPPQSAKSARAKAAHLKAHQPERAKTLIRRAAQKPKASLKPVIKPQAPAEVMAKPRSEIMHKRSVYAVDPVRHQRATEVGRHQAVRHFHPHNRPPAIHSIAAEVPVIAVRAAPEGTRPLQHANKHSDIFEAAIARATSHQQPAHKPRRHHSRSRRLANRLAIVAAFLVIGGFVTYLNLPQLQLRVASFHAGFGASMPGYAPTGYALQDGVKRNGGTISLHFRSGDSSYTITQQSSDWNSQTLLDNTLALNGRHQTVQKNGQTIYIYEDSTRASWVNGGVRYDIAGNAELSPDDVIAIATSL
jgi:hypothetical protein